VFCALVALGFAFICAIAVDAENGASGQAIPVNHSYNSVDSRYDGLVGYWNFDEGIGDMAYDHSGNNNNGILRNGPGWAAGISGHCLEFDGIDDFVEILDAPGLDISGTEITFTAWVKSPAYHDLGWIMGKGRAGDWNEMVWWLLPRSNGSVRYAIKSGGSTIEQLDIPVGLTPEVWHHVGVVYDGSYMRFYIDGSEADNAPKTGNLNTNDASIIIGWDAWALSNYYFGSIDEVKIYSRALSPSEMESEYRLNMPALYLNFDEASGDIAFDQSGNGNNGTLTGGTTRASGISGRAAQFDGIDDYVIIPDAVSLDISGYEITFMAWVYSSHYNDYGYIMGKGEVGPWENMVWWLLPRTSGAVRYAIKSGGSTIEQLEIPAGLTTNVWHHTAVVYDGSEMKFFLDGVQKDSAPKTGLLDVNDAPIYMGLDAWNPSHHYLGLIDEAKVFAAAYPEIKLREHFFQKRCGDLDGNGIINILDIIDLVNYKFKGGPAPEDLGVADCDGNGSLNVLDIVMMVNYKFKGGTRPVCM